MTNVLVTGGAGYIGSVTVLRLLEEGYGVTIIDNLSTGHRWAVPRDAELAEMDLKDKEGLDRLFQSRLYGAVMHFAASIEVGESMKNPGFYFENNVMNGLKLLEAMKERGVKNVIFSSSAAVYGNPEKIPIAEDAKLNPESTYGLTKMIFEKMLWSYEQAYGMRYVSLRYFNACGAMLDGSLGQQYDPPTHLIPRILLCAKGKLPCVEIYGIDYPTKDGTCIRDYIHVLDLADAHVLALKHLLDGGKSTVYNLGNGNGFSVREVIEMAKKMSGKDFPVVEMPRRQGDPAILVADSSKIQTELGWKPQYSSLETILDSAWKWHRK